MTKQRQKLRLFFCTMLVANLLFSTSPVFAETVQDVPVGETTISSKAEDPLKEYKERAQNQVPMVESVESQDVPGKASETETSPTELKETSGDSPTPTNESSEEQSEIINQRIETRGGGIMPLAGNTLREGLPGDPLPYDIDKNFADAIRAMYGGPNPMTDDFMESLTHLNISQKDLASIKGVEYAKNLITLDCSYNFFFDLPVSNLTALTDLDCYSNNLSVLDLSKNTALTRLRCDYNQLLELDLSKNIKLQSLTCSNNMLSGLDVKKCTKLNRLACDNNNLSELDVSKNVELTELTCVLNNLRFLDVSKNIALTQLKCFRNQLSDLDVSKNVALNNLDCNNNHITDITSAKNLSNLQYLDASSQSVFLPVPSVSVSGETEIDILRTTAHTGLSASNGNVDPLPSFAYNGDKILLSNVTRESLSEKYIRFAYDGTQLAEGSPSTSVHAKKFSGTITFYTVSDLGSQLVADKKKVHSGEELEWTWTISSLTEKKAEKIKATLANFPPGLILSSVFTINTNGLVTTENALNNRALGDLNRGETIIITFNTIVNGNVNDWLETSGRLDWEDNTITSPYYNETKGSINILDDEQQDLPKDSADMGILSAPVRFYFGRQNISSGIETYNLAAQNYQTNTNVVTDGFYTRIKDEQTVSTGWKLTASLSEFKDSGGRAMPNGAGASLKLDNLFIQKVTDRDTPQEAIDPTPTGTPSTVQTDEILVTGQTAKTLVSAQVGEGQGTWQLRMPFDDISLTLPAGAGKSNTDYTAKLTWSLDDIP